MQSIYCILPFGCTPYRSPFGFSVTSPPPNKHGRRGHGKAINHGQEACEPLDYKPINKERGRDE